MVRDGKFSDGRETPVGGQGFFRVFLFRNFTIELPFAMAKGLLNYALRITHYELRIESQPDKLQFCILHFAFCIQNNAFAGKDKIRPFPRYSRVPVGAGNYLLVLSS